MFSTFQKLLQPGGVAASWAAAAKEEARGLAAMLAAVLPQEAARPLLLFRDSQT